MPFGLFGRARGFDAFDAPRRLQLGIVEGGGTLHESVRHVQPADPFWANR
jgi:hypothetical protein